VRDVAMLAEVSPATVTRVLSKSDYPVRAHVRQRVLEAAEMLAYTPRSRRGASMSNKSTLVSVIIPNISNPFYQEATISLQRDLESSGFEVIICNTFRRAEKDREYLATMFKMGVRGVILSASTDEKDIISYYIDKGMKFVLLDQVVFDEDLCPRINADILNGVFLAVEHLIQNGHRKIAYISTPLVRWSRQVVFEGFVNALMQSNIEFPNEYLLLDDNDDEFAESSYEYRSGFKLAQEFLKRGLDATAVVVINDMTAIGTIQGFTSQGVRVPEDVSVVSFDNTFFSEQFKPELTTIGFPAHEIGRLAAQILSDQMKNNESRPMTIKMQPKLVVRNTVRNLNA